MGFLIGRGKYRGETYPSAPVLGGGGGGSTGATGATGATGHTGATGSGSYEQRRLRQHEFLTRAIAGPD